VTVVGVAAVLMVAGVSLSRQALAEHYRAEASSALGRQPARAVEEADRALRLDPEMVAVYYTKAAALARFNDADGARAALREALRREPDDFVTWTLLGDLEVRRGAIGAARRSYRGALRRNPLDPSLQALVRDPRLALAGGP
jgi:tetratricopeptide (TPR) repeat protein